MYEQQAQVGVKDDDEGVQFMAVCDLLAERESQDDMWGDQTHDPAYWLAILGKQVGQLGSAVLSFKWASDEARLPSKKIMYKEATQVAAVAVAIMEAIEADRLSDEVTSAKPEPRKLARVLGRDDESLHARAMENHSDAPVAPPEPSALYEGKHA